MTDQEGQTEQTLTNTQEQVLRPALANIIHLIV